MYAGTGTLPVAHIDRRLADSPTIRHKDCEVLVAEREMRCPACTGYRPSLRAISSRDLRAVEADQRTAPDSHTNYRYLSTPEKDRRLSRLHAATRNTKKSITHMQARLAEVSETSGISVDPGIHDDMVTVMEAHTQDIHQRHAPDTFARLFWDQQLQASRAKTTSGMRWHPLMIKWCIYLRHLSSSSYEALRQSGCVTLPSQRTLRDYTHFSCAQAGFSVDTDQQLLRVMEVQTCPEWKKQVVLLMDEMHIKADLVYDKFSGELSIETAHTLKASQPRGWALSI